MALDLLIREQYGQLNFVGNTIESLTPEIDIEIGLTSSAADLKLNRNTVLAPGKTFGFVDIVTSDIVRLSVSGGVLDIDGANQLQVGELKFVENTIESILGSTDIQIGLTGSSADLVLNRNTVIAPNKTLTIQGATTITGSLTLSSGSALSINNGFYVDGNRQFNYGQFSSTQTQSGLADTAYSMTFNTVDFQKGIVLVGGPGNSSIAVVNTGVYNIQFSTQLHTTTNQAVDFSIWFAKNGTDIPNSNTDFTIEKVSGGGFVVAALNFLIQLQSNDYVELKYSKTTIQGQLQAKEPQINPTRPGTPSVIITITQIA